jgi:hypothetical protein
MMMLDVLDGRLLVFCNGNEFVFRKVDCVNSTNQKQKESLKLVLCVYPPDILPSWIPCSRHCSIAGWFGINSHSKDVRDGDEFVFRNQEKVPQGPQWKRVSCVAVRRRVRQLGVLGGRLALLAIVALRSVLRLICDSGFSIL